MDDFLSAMRKKNAADDQRRSGVAVCGSCLGPAHSLCGKCRVEAYCSTKCQADHWRVHRRCCMDMGDGQTTDRAGGQMYTADLIDKPKLCADCSVRKSRFEYSVAELKLENPTCAECLLVRAATAAASEPCAERDDREHACSICLLNEDDAKVFSNEGEPLMPAMYCLLQHVLWRLHRQLLHNWFGVVPTLPRAV
jgi:hypothetical protein